ncbi:RDD family protein [Chryseobacterium sp. NKUCC03_KSP]|uniref:RDD family protein n=1 Tax=Chryseobacterium sp. NKUCC03_KSP TaxID=2842125 RepID=UPI001C5BB369|nr:RDD family protein [Chryseobacterium sp. NKUCC03_KSP]MBW3521351.1 RDD family protein [Chryseobacterium sp. NKUCC03_KSP]
MEKNYRFIAISSLAISLIGILSCFYSFYRVWNGASQFNTIPEIFRILFSFSTLNLDLTNRFEHLDIWNFVFYLLLFIGSLQFIKTKGKETRFIGFVFSVIFLDAIIVLLQSTFYKFFITKWQDATSLQIFSMIIGYLALLGVLYISYRVLKLIKSEKEIDVIETENKTIVTDTGKWQRSFHWAVDLAVMSLIIIPVIISFAYWLSDSGILNGNETLQMFFRGRWSLYTIIFIFILIYYPISEILFGSSPGKFLTESRVVNSKAGSPNSSKIFLRTLCRNIPFDALSFFSKRGWHDSLSETYVVKEKRTGFKTNRSLWILPILGIYLLVMYFGKRYYTEYKANIEFNNTMSEKLNFLGSEIKNPNTNQFFVVNDVDYYGNIKNYGFKIEKIEGSKITIKRIIGESLSGSSFEQAKYLYEQQKDTAKIFVIRKYDLVNIFPNNQEELYRPVKTLEFFEPGIHYGIENVYNFNAPFLKAHISKDDNDYTNKKVTMYLHNLGASGTITNIKNQNNEIRWKTNFPLKMDDPNSSPVVIQLENYNFTEVNISKIEVLDSLNKKHYFMIKTDGLTNEISELK